jgi:hypothetical protein
MDGEHSGRDGQGKDERADDRQPDPATAGCPIGCPISSLVACLVGSLVAHGTNAMSETSHRSPTFVTEARIR